MSKSKMERDAVQATLWASERDGNVYMEKDELIRKCMTQHTYLSKQRVEAGILENLAEGAVIADGDHYSICYTVMAENRVAAFCANSIKNESMADDIDWAKALEDGVSKLDIKLSASQKEAALGALSHSFSIITGGAGSGKTTLMRAICEAYHQKFPYDQVLMMAPTGKAARRLAEQTRHSAYTVHAVVYSERANCIDMHNNYRASLVIVDEASMVDMQLMWDILSHLKRGIKLILVGDVAQLPSVGPGRVLRDLLASGLSAYRLTDNFRQVEANNALTSNVDRIRNMDYNLTFDDSFKVLPAPNSHETAEAMLELYVHYKMSGKMVQMLSPVGKSGCCSTTMLNKRAQALVNPPCAAMLEVTIGERVFRVGDRIVQLTNNDYGRNGDVGTITGIRSEDNVRIVLSFDDHEREVSYSVGEIQKDNLLDHAYALTVHKAQGSEYDYVILPLVSEQSFACYRNMLYTAVSRARKSVILVGRYELLEIAIQTSMPSRNTDLLFKIQSLLNADAA